MSKWTPGPWRLNEDNRHVGADGETIVGEAARLNPAEFARVAADRALITEAPAMAEALVALVGFVEHLGFTHSVGSLGVARAILARINGDAP